MKMKKKLTRKQLAVIDELFAGGLTEQEILEKYKISRAVYNKWLADEAFEAEMNRRIHIARLQSEALIARYSLVAAAKLVQLTESDKEETARRACLDIISLPRLTAVKPSTPEKPPRPVGDEKPSDQLSDETASRLLAVLAEEKDG